MVLMDVTSNVTRNVTLANTRYRSNVTLTRRHAGSVVTPGAGNVTLTPGRGESTPTRRSHGLRDLGCRVLASALRDGAGRRHSLDELGFVAGLRSSLDPGRPLTSKRCPGVATHTGSTLCRGAHGAHNRP